MLPLNVAILSSSEEQGAAIAVIGSDAPLAGIAQRILSCIRKPHLRTLQRYHARGYSFGLQ